MMLKSDPIPVELLTQSRVSSYLPGNSLEDTDSFPFSCCVESLTGHVFVSDYVYMLTRSESHPVMLLVITGCDVHMEQGVTRLVIFLHRHS